VRADLATRSDWITTYSGHPFFPLEPSADDVRIADIAHSLSLLCRFAGHTRTFYSVAQHSVLVSMIVGEAFAPWGLLHDASEAYLCDITRPVKHQAALDGYRQLEARVQAAIYERFGLSVDEPACVKEADTLVLLTEQRDLMAMPDGWSLRGRPTLPFPIVPMCPRQAEIAFLERFHELMATA
jgi:hypothetical protein